MGRKKAQKGTITSSVSQLRGLQPSVAERPTRRPHLLHETAKKTREKRERARKERGPLTPQWGQSEMGTAINDKERGVIPMPRQKERRRESVTERGLEENKKAEKPNHGTLKRNDDYAVVTSGV